jgi:hypothetical protein
MLNVIWAEGFVFQHEGTLVLQQEGKDPESLADLLSPMLNQHINIAFHFVPPNGLDETKWGFGSCTWEGRGTCPVEHHIPEHRQRMLSVKADGVLLALDGIWMVREFSGQLKKLPLPLLDGHYARLAIAPVLDIEKMRDALSASDMSKVEVLGQQAEHLQGVLQNIQQAAADLPKLTPEGKDRG